MLSSISLILRLLLLAYPSDYSSFAILLLWAARILSLSLVFRTYIGPSIVRLVSRRVRIRSVSLRSIRGIYFRTGSGTWRIDRVGLSYHRPSATTASRFSIVVEGLKLELTSTKDRSSALHTPSNQQSVWSPRALPPLLQQVWSVVWRAASTIYRFLEPYARPVIRTSFVGALRLLIQALPALTHVVDFELNSAQVTLSALPGVEFNLTHAELSTKVSLTSLENTIIPKDTMDLRRQHRHQRFASIADWNTRLNNSLRRTWDRAWGATRVTTSVTLTVKDITGRASASSLKDLGLPVLGVASFVDIPAAEFTVSVRVDPHRTIEPHSVETCLKVDSVDINVDILRFVLRTAKRHGKGENAPIDCDAKPASSTPSATFSLSRLDTRRTTWSPMSPTSPLMEVLSSASTRFGWGQKQIPVRKLSSGDVIQSRLSMVKSLDFKIGRISLRHCPPRIEKNFAQTFTASLHQVHLSTGLSHPDVNMMHRKYLGSRSVPDDDLSSDVYRLSLSTNLFTLDRSGSGIVLDHLQVVSAGPLHLDSIVSQWPSPWMHGPAFMYGDPNSQLLAVHLNLGTVRLTERLEVLRGMLSGMKKSERHAHSGALLPTILSPLPRIALGINVGPVVARLISTGVGDDDRPFALEARTDGFLLSLDSQYLSLADKHLRHIAYDHLGLHLDFYLSCTLQHTFVSVCFGSDLTTSHSSGSDPASSDYPGEGLVSLDAIHVSSHASAIGDIMDGTHSAITMDLPSLFTDIQCSTEAVCIELWQPDVLRAISSFAVHLGESSKGTVPMHDSPHYVLDHLPFGLSTTLAIGRFVIFVTGPDLAPGEDMEISRGVVMHTGISVTYCAIHNKHAERIQHLLPRSQQRLNLALPTEYLVKAVAGTTAPAAVPSIRVLLGVALWDIGMRDAIATRYTADDPYCYAEATDDQASKDFLRVQNVSLDIILSGMRPFGSHRPGIKDDAIIAVCMSRVHSSLRLAHVYSLLLAVQTLRSLSPPSTQTQRNTAPRPPSTLTLNVQFDVNDLQLIFEFPQRSKLLTRISFLRCLLPSKNKLDIKWSSIILAVAIAAVRDEQEQEEWKEFIRFTEWQLNIPLADKSSSIAVEGDSGRLHIPFDFVLADLILDINLTIKSVRHLMRVVPTGIYEDPPNPPAESAKIAPNIAMKIRCLTFDAADNDLESRLGLIWRTGLDASRVRLERDEAFQAKASLISHTSSSQTSANPTDADPDFQFSSKHTVSIDNARERLNQVHSVAWKSSIMKASRAQRIRHESYSRHATGKNAPGGIHGNLVDVIDPGYAPPLCRLTLDLLSLQLSAPPSLVDNVSDFLYTVGSGLPKETTFSLLVPLHVNFTLASLRFTFREYPLPLLNVPPTTPLGSPALEFDSNIVIAEEMGSDASVERFPSEVVSANSGVHGANSLSIAVPKTIMPVKTYAEPTIRILTKNTTDLAWGVSYSPATQDFMRIIDTFSHAPRDCSPAIGFWDKLRLIFHWRLQVLFEGEVHFHMKGSRDPHAVVGTGAGFALCWRGNPRLLIGQQNSQKELIQVVSDSMLIIIPNLQDTWGNNAAGDGEIHPQSVSSIPFGSYDPRKSRDAQVCAKFSSGVRFGVGFALERSCSMECSECSGKPFDRRCRFFDFRPHYQVRLETKAKVPEPKSPEDSYNGFRSDFIHMSLSLTSALGKAPDVTSQPSSVHLSPEAFEHFWAWYSLFDGALSLPIRQGSLYSRKRPVSPKLGQHLATLKYSVSIVKLFIAHLYADNSRDAWADGVTPFIGIKALIDHFQADMHQRDQESTRVVRGSPRAVHHKSFYAVEVVMKDLDLRSMLAIFPEPLKQQVRIESSPLTSNYRSDIRADATPMESPWIDLDDFRRIERSLSAAPDVYLLPAAKCPQFTYFKRDPNRGQELPNCQVVRSKFGNEDTHDCFIDKEASVTQIQIGLTNARVQELEHRLRQKSPAMANDDPSHYLEVHDPQEMDDQDAGDLRKNIALLKNYALHLRKLEAATANPTMNNMHNYYMPSDAVSQEEWAEFDNVYQLHSPQIFMTQTIRDIMMQYYYCSRSKRGIEYHMATRAVKFIRDQANAALSDLLQGGEERRGPVSTAHAAAIAVRNFLAGDGLTNTIVDTGPAPGMDVPDSIDPLDGWSQGVSLEKSHFCLLLKPQIVLRSEASSDTDTDHVCVLAAVQGKSKSFAILDNANLDDPVSGKVMSRNFASVTGLQTFSPSVANRSGEEHVPLEVLIDLRCANHAFDRLVPQTDASFQYDKFNRLRLRNNATSLSHSTQEANDPHGHLQNQNDLIRVHVPRFTVSANDRHFQAISSIVTKLILFSDAALKDRSDKLEKMLFSYDFTHLASTADVIARMQARLRHALEVRREALKKLKDFGDDGLIEIYKIDAHIFLLADELNLIFDAIALAQDKANDHPEQKSALLLHASSSEISWGMLDRQDQLLAKLAVRDIHFHWLSRQDSSTANNLVVGDLQAFDGAADAEWTEILSKHDEPSTHPLVKKKLFLVADWTVLPPVGGITIYERFEITFHPMRLQIDTRIGRKIMEYVWPARRHRHGMEDLPAFDDIPESPSVYDDPSNIVIMPESPSSPRRSSWDVSPRHDSQRLAPSPLRKLGSSRSFTDLRNARNETLQAPQLHKTRSTDALMAMSSRDPRAKSTEDLKGRSLSMRKVQDSIDDAAEMKSRSSQKTFVWVKVNSLHLLLSIAKEDSFLCRDAQIRTRALEYRNQTWSFEELVDQFIPSGKNWRGWVKMAFQQPLVPVFPVARELFSKTKWISTKGHPSSPHDERSGSLSLLQFPGRLVGSGSFSTTSSSSRTSTSRSTLSAGSEKKRQRGISLFNRPSRLQPVVAENLTTEPEPITDANTENETLPRPHRGRPRVLSVFKRRHGTPRSSIESDMSTGSTMSRSSMPPPQHSDAPDRKSGST